ncbi:DUF1828 domain-containing protein [Bdellovibrio bacteriovorus]|uniref:DUF1828 domain-containing protein n=1 Tax=Bdellovibrio bacteriovorus TaxID=959 RepID=UPI0035A5EAB9
MNPFQLYLEWLVKHTSVESEGEWQEVTLPFLDRHNDHIQIYIKRSVAGEFIFSDGGATLSNLTMSGFTKTQRRAQILGTILRGFDTKLNENNQIWTQASSENIGYKFQSFLQTILSTDNLGYFSEENVKSMFFEDVSAWLSQNEISYISGKEFKGKSGYTVDFPFYIPGKAKTLPSVIQLIGNPKVPFKPLLFEWIDSEASRGRAQSFTIINDDQIKPSKKLFQAFEKYEIEPILWSERDVLLKRIS